MNTYTLLLKGSNKDLAVKEFESLWFTYTGEKINLENEENQLYIFQSNMEIEKSTSWLSRLAYTNYIGVTLSNSNDLEKIKEDIKELNLDYLNSQTFCVRIKKARTYMQVEHEEKELAKVIWDKLENPKVSIDNPNEEFNFIFTEKSQKVFFSKKLFTNTKEYKTRMPKVRPVAMPYTLKSDIARACVNLLQTKEEEIILDPFCGIGGILLEAQDMNMQVIGNDISWNDLHHIQTNFDHYYPQNTLQRTLADARTQFLKSESIDGIVTDIPYGKSSRKLGDELYDKALENFKKMLKPKKRLVIIYSNLVNFKPLALQYFKEVCEIEEYINKGMQRKILILEN